MRFRTLVAGAATVAAYSLAVRPWHLRWGATDEEVGANLPGDELLPSADLVATRAISIQVDPRHVWPWIAQLGQGRGGFYSYDAIENLAGCDIHSAERIVAELQDPLPGDQIRLHPEVSLDVVRVEPDEALVLRGGVPMGDTPAPYDFVGAFVLRERPDGGTRLIVRERYAYRTEWAALLVEPVGAASFVMTQKMMRGIRARSERERALADTD